MNPQRYLGGAFLFLACLATPLLAIPPEALSVSYQLNLRPADRDRVNLPATAEIPLPDHSREKSWTADLRGPEGSPRTVQMESGESSDGGTILIHWVEPFTGTGEAPEFALTLTPAQEVPQPSGGFRFERNEKFQDLFLGDRGVFRYVTFYDPQRHADTHKPYHQIYGFNGEGFLTKGPGGQYPHHKGIFLGWNRTRLPDGKKYDFWTAPKEYQQHSGFLDDRQVAGPVLARSVSRTDWKTPDGSSAVRDTREVTTWNLAEDEILLDYVITIESLGGEVYLGGDAHHSGFHFRASDEVGEKAEETVFISNPGAEGVGDDIWGNLPWVAMSIEIQGNPYTVLHLNHSENNPAPAVYSTRGYGRFGAFFTSMVKEEAPLLLKYRIIVKGAREGDGLSPAALDARHADYLAPPCFEVVAK